MENVECINVISNFFPPSLFMGWRFERVRLRVTINTLSNHLFRFVSFIHFHFYVEKKWAKVKNKVVANRTEGIGRIILRTEKDISIILEWWKPDIGHYESIFILCWCDFYPLFSSRRRWRPAGECKHHNRVPVCVRVLCCFIPFWSYLRLSWLA